MQISMTARNLTLTPAGEQYLREHIRLALRRFGARIRSVETCLRDVNGPKGGVDKQVSIRLRLRSGELVLAEARSASTGAAMAVAIRRARRIVRRRTGRARRLEKQTLRALGRGHSVVAGSA